MTTTMCWVFLCDPACKLLETRYSEVVSALSERQIRCSVKAERQVGWTWCHPACI